MGRDHSCEVCGRGGMNDDEECVCVVGALVEWTMATGTTARGRVSRVGTSGRIYVAMQRTNNRGRIVTSEVWFDRDEESAAKESHGE